MMRDLGFSPLCSLVLVFVTLNNEVRGDISIQPNPTYIPASNSSVVAITCTGNYPDVGFILGITLERNLARDSDTRDLVTMSDSSAPQLDSNAPEDLLNRNPNLEVFFLASNTSSYFTLTFDTSGLECSDMGEYICGLSYVDTSFQPVTGRSRKTMEVRYTPTNVTLTVYKNGTEVKNVSENAHDSFLVGEVAQFQLVRLADNASTFECFRTNVSDSSDTLVPFSPNVTSTSSRTYENCNFLLNTTFDIVITENDARRRNSFIVQCSVTSGSTVYSRKIYLGVEHDFCEPSPCVNGNCSNSDSDTGFTCSCDEGYTGTICNSIIDYCVSNPCENGICNTSVDGFRCTCYAGYTGLTCDTDINECMSPSCANNSECSNTNGGYLCTCNAGFIGDGKEVCIVCQFTNNCNSVTPYPYSAMRIRQNMNLGQSSTAVKYFSGDGKETCIDINECLNTTACASDSACTNTPGSFTCMCNIGFTGNGNIACTDIDECLSPNACAVNAECSNVPGSFACMCDDGFSGDGKHNCTDINECLNATICANNSSCSNMPGSFTCTCNTGFTGDGKESCTDIDECTSSNSCAVNAECTNVPGSFTCTCEDGFSGDGQSNCTDINECLSSDACTDNAECTNTDGSYMCTCNTGFTGNGIDTCSEIDFCAPDPCRNGICNNTIDGYLCTCSSGYTGLTCDTDIDECLLYSSCVNESTCTNLNGSYTCTCNEGFTGDGKEACTDINECLNTSACSSDSACSNTPGSFTCMCNIGFTGNGYIVCTDIDECLSSNPCADNAECSNVPGSFTCMCDDGFSGDGQHNCTDINECQSPDACADNADCTNTNGDYTCSCSNGFTGDGKDTCTEIGYCASTPCANGVCNSTTDGFRCTCNAGYTGFKCDTDINECLSSDACTNNAACTNTPGSYICTCNTGLTGNGMNECTDINECSSSASCADNAACTNTHASYTCSCNTGFTGDGKNTCNDINECSSSNPCTSNALCTNTVGSYTCKCNSGFEGDGKNNCTDINECSNSPCQNSGYCYNYAGSFRCYCSAGWTGVFCQTDINECARAPCALNAACTNTAGSYTCTCSDGFIGDGSVKCTQNVLVSVQNGYHYYRSDDSIYGFYISGGLEYFGKRYYIAYVSMNGYITLGRRYNLRYPWTSSNSWRSIRYPIIAPLWADIDTRGSYGQTGMYVNQITSRTVLYNTIRPVIGDKDFWPRYCLMATWKKAVPYPYSLNNRFEAADFQVLLATNSSYTYVIFNYDQEQFTWQHSGGRLVVVGYSSSNYAGNIVYSSSNFANVNKGSNVDINGRWRFSVSLPGSPLERAKALCINWFLDSYVQYLVSYARLWTSPCPCSYSQVIRDWRFSYAGYSNGIYYYRERWTRYPYSQRQRCHYRVYYLWWWIRRGYLVYGYPGGGFMESYDSRLEISDAYNNCCLQGTGLCHLFYHRNPSRTCSGYRPPSWRPANGDPHITTLDGTRYTFNGRGEYTFVEIKEENVTLTVQVRTDLVTNDDPDATIFVGIAGKDGTDGDIVEIILDREANSSNIYISGNHNGTFASAVPENLLIEANRVTVFNDSDKLVLAFESGLSLQVSVHNLLDIVTSAPSDGVFAGNTRGLLGNNDGNGNNDFMLQNGTVLSVNSTEERLFDFGISWMISENESLFNYTVSGNTFDYYNNLTIRPNNFIRDMLNNLTGYLETNCPGKDINADAIEEACGDNVACKVDAAATCDTEFGKASKDVEEQVEEENEVLENFPPNITGPDILYIGYKKNKTVFLELEKYITDSNLDTISIETSIPEKQFSFENNIFQWNVSEQLRSENKTVYVRFNANDTMGASSENWPDLYYCGCESDTECDFSLVLEDYDNEDHFYKARCNCSEERDGTNCETIKDRCDPNPCYENVTCHNNHGDNPCGECPAGMNGDGLRCEDTNECHMDPSPCNQTCENVIGSYICSCIDGYTLDDDGLNCSDIDECEKRETNECAEHESCVNTQGEYECQCSPGYATSNGACEKVFASFVGLFIFQTEDNNTVTEEAVEMLLNEEIPNHEERIIAVEVTKMLKMGVISRRRDDAAKHEYNTTFVLHSANATLETEDVIQAFNDYKETIVDAVPIVSNKVRILVDVNKDDSKVYKDNEYGICNITDKVMCDLDSTVCNNEDGVQTCNCKGGFQPWSVQYVSCKDIDECTINDGICGDHGTCTNFIGTYTCTCDSGFKLDDAGICKDVCASNPCKNGGTCIHIDGDDIYSCQCEDGWTGFSCEVENSEAERMQLIAIAVGTSVGVVCVILLCISVWLCRKNQDGSRRYKMNSKGYKRSEYSHEFSEASTSFRQLHIPRPSISSQHTAYSYRNDAFSDGTDTSKADLPIYDEPKQKNQDNARLEYQQKMVSDAKDYF